MTAPFDAIVTLDQLPLDTFSMGTRYAASTAAIGDALGLKWLGAALHVVPPGKSACPFHRHHTQDEMFLVLAGEGEYRIGDRRIPFSAGACLGAPAGGDAHQIFNTGSDELRYVAFSNNSNADVVEYPDSGRVRIDVGADGIHDTGGTFKAGGLLQPLGYWDGEDIGEVE
jgi:uncharacterized cupin superfamily protein